MIDAGYQDFADRWNPILDVFDAEGVRFAHEVHPSEIAYDYWTTVRGARGDRAPRGLRAELGPEPLRLAGPRPGRRSCGTSRTGSTTSTARTRSSRWATAATAGWARTWRGPTRAAAGTSSRPVTATCRGSAASGCSTPSATTARSRSSGRTPGWTGSAVLRRPSGSSGPWPSTPRRGLRRRLRDERLTGTLAREVSRGGPCQHRAGGGRGFSPVPGTGRGALALVPDKS